MSKLHRLIFVESSSFCTFVNCLDPRYQVPSRKQFSSVLLKGHYDQLLTKVKDSLKGVTKLSITMDKRSFTGTTGHYILNWQLESVVLACDRCKGRHTAEKIYQEYKIQSYTLMLLKGEALATDTASNMVKAFKLPSYENEKARDSSEASDLDDSNSSDEEDDDSDEERFSSASDDSTMFDVLPVKHHGCFANVLQIVVKMDLEMLHRLSGLSTNAPKLWHNCKDQL